MILVLLVLLFGFAYLVLKQRRRPRVVPTDDEGLGAVGEAEWIAAPTDTYRDMKTLQYVHNEIIRFRFEENH
jgi:hypothetical protein